MAKNKEIKRFRITGRHKESPDRILSHAKKIVESNPNKDIRFMLSDQAGDNVNTAIKKSGYKFTVNPASKYDAKDLSRGAKLRTEAELKGGVIYSRLAEGGKVKSGYDKHWSDRYKYLQDTNPTNSYDPDTGKLIGRATSATHNPKDLLLAEIKDTKDPAKHRAGVDFVKGKVSAWEAKQKANPVVKKSIPISAGSKEMFQYTEEPKVYSWLNKGQQDKLDIETGDKQELTKVAKWSEQEGTVLTKGFDNAEYDEPLFDRSQRYRFEGSKEYVDEHYREGVLTETGGNGPESLDKSLKNKGTLLSPKYESVDTTRNVTVRGYHKGNTGAVEFEKPLTVRNVKKTSPNENPMLKGKTSWREVEESAQKHGVPFSVKSTDNDMAKEMEAINKMGKNRKWSRKFFFGSSVLGAVVSSLFIKKDLQAKGVKKPTVKQYAHQAAADYIGSPRVLGGVGEKKGYLQKVGLTKKGVSGKRRASGPIKGAGGDSTPYAAITRFFSPSKKNAFKNRARN